MANKQKWTELEIPLNKFVLRTIQDFNFTDMTPVQVKNILEHAACIPLMQKKKDVAVEAITGSGKTLAFLIPALEILAKREEKLKPHEIGILIISPTRELTLQIYSVLKNFLKYLHFSALLLVGGEPIESDIEYYRKYGGNIVVATPGRLEDMLIRQKSCNLINGIKSLELLVLDEADRLLDMGFENTINNIFQIIPKQRQTGLFSATQTKEVGSLIRAGLRNPVVISVREKVQTKVSTPISLSNYFIVCEADEKFKYLIGFIKNQGVKKKFIIFFSTCACVEWFCIVLKEIFADQYIFSLHGKMGRSRHKVLENFRIVDSGIFLCTDILARGIDIPEVDWVLQFDPPLKSTSFVHRVGRTARNGLPGSSLLMVLPTEDLYIDFIQKNQHVKLRKRKIDWEPVETLEKMRNLQLKDRSNFDKANRAFVSFIQSYAKHECSLILRLKDLPFGKLATAFGLLKLPKMPELKNIIVENFSPLNMDFNSISYVNPAKEEARQRKLRIYFETNKWPAKKMKRKMRQTAPWEQSKKRKLEKKMKKKFKNESGGKRKKIKMIENELESLAKDILLIKKMKKKKISEEDFEKEFLDVT